MTLDLAQALIEWRARQLWDAREADFPKFTRMRFEDGTRVARDVCFCAAFDLLEDEGFIAITDRGCCVEITSLGLIVLERAA